MCNNHLNGLERKVESAPFVKLKDYGAERYASKYSGSNILNNAIKTYTSILAFAKGYAGENTYGKTKGYGGK